MTPRQPAAPSAVRCQFQQMRVRTHVRNLFDGRGFFFVRPVLTVGPALARGVSPVLVTVDAAQILPTTAAVLRLLDRRQAGDVADGVLQAVESALLQAPALMTPRAAWVTRTLAVQGDELVALGRSRGESPLRWRLAAVPSRLAAAGRASLVVVTLGPGLEEESTAAFRRGDYLLGLALDAAGTAAVHRLMAESRTRVRAEALHSGFEADVPSGPGYERWPLEELPAVTAAAGGPAAGVAVTSGLMLSPGKSLCRVIPWRLP